jgi:hypothetical protein
MGAESQIAVAARAPARLLIRAADGRRTEHGSLGHVLLRLRALAADHLQRRPAARAGVRIDSLQGCPCFAFEDVGSLIDVPLPAGTYHVTVVLGAMQRRYTVTLEHGATFDLRLPLAMDRP